jgi:SsrA-binding protein
MAAETTEAKNRRAAFEYHLLDRFECGMVLMGSEIKSIRSGGAAITDAFCTFLGQHLVVRNMRIAPWGTSIHFVHEPARDRMLLLHRSELRKLRKVIKDQGVTIVPLRVFINEKGYAKLEIAVAKGKKLHDKRASIKEREARREMDREA